jgi:RND family efflux transporter MFP subunit
MKKIIAVVVLVAVGAYFLLTGSRPDATTREAWLGKAVRAVPGSVIVTAEYEMNLKSEVGGRVVASELDPGASFGELDFLVQIDSSDLELEIERIENDYEATKAKIEVGSAIELDLATARESLAAALRLTKSGNMSETAYRQQEREVQQIEQKLKRESVDDRQALSTYENTLALKRRELAKMTISSPFECVVAEVYARPGDLIGSNSPIALLISTSRTVEARISEENFSNIRIGQPASVRLLGYGNEQFNAKVLKILPAADAQTRRYTVHLDVEIEQSRLVPGLTGEVSIVTAERANTVLIPRRALIGDKVMVVVNGDVEVRTVEKGYESLNEVEILSGVESGELIITDELDLFRDGQKVTTAEKI